LGGLIVIDFIDMRESKNRSQVSIEYSSFVTCKHCHGKGITPSKETLGLGFLRKLSLEMLKDEISGIKGIIPHDVADYLLNKKRKELLDLEARHGITVSLERDADMIPGESKIICEK